ncbi:MAG: 2-C-methyl-D-erythritol 4-phosphate cytidylyltransferase [Sporolactobacillus sp.]|jgi:2-C-methyl-D-erythritol 4-phosphate cytidylyltransferase|nr:2-C-methyl-D-erythritol 4-phosphate cytidylyltransferase [Sporolactobacillus sp.]
MNYQVVVVAAGKGSRMGAECNKVLLPLKGVPVIIRTLRVFEQDPDCIGVVLVVKEAESRRFSRLVDGCRLRKVQLTAGGRERQDSVYNGLMRIDGSGADIVLIHDGARPFIDQGVIRRTAKAAEQFGAALAAVPVKDTVKRCDSEGYVTQTLERSSLWAAQTPQAFRLSEIVEAYRSAAAAHVTATDDASLMERIGRPVRTVMGSYRNIKLTTPEDMLLAETILEEEEHHANRSRI